MFLFLFVLVFTLSFVSSFDVYACGDLNSENEVYDLMGAVSSDGSCFNVLADNVTLDCHGRSLTFGNVESGRGVNLSSYNNFTIRNCEIVFGSDSLFDSFGIYVDNSTNLLIDNVDIYSYSAKSDPQNNLIFMNNVYDSEVFNSNFSSLVSRSSRGAGSNSLNLRNSNNLIFYNNTFKHENGNSGVFDLFYVTNSDFIDNSMETWNSVSHGFLFEEGVNSNNFYNNTIFVHDGDSYYSYSYNNDYSNCFFISSSRSNVFRNNSLTSLGGAAFSFSDYNEGNNDIDSSNLVEEKPVYYNYSLTDYSFDNFDFRGYGQVICFDCNNVSYVNSNFSNDGLSLFYGQDIKVLDSNITANNSNAVHSYKTNNIYFNNSVFSVLNEDISSVFIENLQGGNFENSIFYSKAVWNSYFDDVINFRLNDNKIYLNNGAMYLDSNNDLVGNFNLTNNYFEGINYCFETTRGVNYVLNFRKNIFNTSFGNALHFDRGSFNVNFYEDDFFGNSIDFTYDSAQNLSFYDVKNLGDINFNGATAVINVYNKLSLEIIDTLGVGVSFVLSMMSNVLGGLILDDLSDSFGKFDDFFVLEYIQTASGVNDYSPYEINFSKVGFYDIGYNFDLNSSKEISFEIFENVFPEIVFGVDSLGNNSGANERFFTNISINEGYLSNVTWYWNDEVNTTLDIGGFKPVPLLFDGLVSFWNADNLGEDQIFGNNLTFYGDANISDGVYGEGFGFDGDLDYARSNNAFSNVGSEGFTFSAWVYVDSEQGDDFSSIFSIGEESSTEGFLRLDLDNSLDRLYVRYSDGTSVVSSYSDGIIKDNWVFLTVSYDYLNEVLELYVDCELQTLSQSEFFVLPIETKNLHLSSNEGDNYFLNGSMDEIMIFNKSLSENEVNQLYKTFSRKFGEGNYSVYYNETSYSQFGDSEVVAYSVDPNFEEYSIFVEQSGLLAGSFYNYKMGAYDLSGNYNETELRFVKGNSEPIIFSVVQSINNSNYNEIDPGVLISFDVDVFDSENNLDYVEFEIWNLSLGDWDSYEMDNLSLYNFSTSFIYSFITSFEETNYTYRIKAVDLEGGVGYSENKTLESFWDCSWDAVLNFDSGVGFNQNKNLGNLTILNLGDSEYLGGCSLNFMIDTNMEDNKIYYDGVGYGNAISYNVLEGESLSLPINASFYTELKEETVSLIVEETLRMSDKRYKINNFTLVTNENGPYFFLEFDSVPSFVYLKDEPFLLKSSLRNLMGDVVVNVNNTAYNVTFSSFFPDGVEIFSGESQVEFDNISDDFKHQNEVVLSFSDVKSFTPGIKNIKLVATGVDNLGNEILNVNNASFELIYSINFLCNPESDGIYVEACGILDGDYVAPVPVRSSGGGGSSGGSSSGIDDFETSEELQIVRGKENEVEVVFENLNKEKSLYDLEFSVSGDIAKYIEVLPKSRSVLEPKSNISVKLLIVSPGYIDIGRQRINVKMIARDGNRIYTENRKLDLEIHDLSSDDAKELVDKSRFLMADLLLNGLYSDDLFELFDSSVHFVNNFNYEGVKENYEEINAQVRNGIKAKNQLDILREFVFVSEEKGIDIKKTLRLMKLSELSLSRGDFEKAYQLIQDAQMSYALETRGKIGKVIYYLKNYPYEILGSLISLFLISFFAYKLIYLKVLNRKLKVLKHQNKVYTGLIKTVQKDCFADKKMSMDEYNIAVEEYRKKVSSIIQDIIYLEVRKKFLFKIMSKTKRMYFERDRILDEIKNIQKKYLRDKRIEAPEYEANMESYTARLSEIEEKIATAEAKAEYKKIRRKRK